ncbi:TetR family transcriptional regulator [Microbacterium sp. VKM Ac-2870]|uniref:TetR/AcrR family transcriptional regulator n=1 Tax=Microbacterium sp. VKM Ac-2870 TaxID=2783825 RepID=UPI00188B1C24|nr:TetR family transcriptional regulator [Microbacterium sp. VKM Ac-2870]MBF4561162.1 TetR family transcriptional regulator [Microbacterium sp. VKM Ac-2870]
MTRSDTPSPTEKGRRSRASILRAAAERFESDGFEKTTVRAIAKDAAIDAAMIIRYFGSKEALFLEATSIELDLPQMDAVPHGQLGHALARHAVSLWESETPGRALRILLRASAQDEQGAAARVRSVFAAQVLPFLSQEGSDDAMRASLVSSQILGYAFGRYVIGFDPLVDLGDEEAATRLGAALQAVIDAP